jgi:DNA sulfur modification protein DndE
MLAIRLGKRASELCISAKRKTGLQHMNEVCRLAFFYSLAHQSNFTYQYDGSGSVEIEWGTFAGKYSSVIYACALHDMRGGSVDEKEVHERIVNRISGGLVAIEQINNQSFVTSIANACIKVRLSDGKKNNSTLR